MEPGTLGLEGRDLTTAQTPPLWLLHSVIGSKLSRHFLNQSKVKQKPTVACACTFSRALCRLRVITSSFDWLTGLSPTFLIGQSNYFGFGFTTLNWKLLYCVVWVILTSIGGCIWRHSGHVGVQNNALKCLFGNLSLLLCQTCGAIFYCFVRQHGCLITWMQTKNNNKIQMFHKLQ